MKRMTALLMLIVLMLAGCGGPQRVSHLSGITAVKATRDGVVLTISPGMTAGDDALDGQIIMTPGQDMVMTNGRSVTLALKYLGREDENFLFEQEVWYANPAGSVDKGQRRVLVQSYEH